MTTSFFDTKEQTNQINFYYLFFIYDFLIQLKLSIKANFNHVIFKLNRKIK